MAKKPNQDEMFPQKRIGSIENYVDKADERREMIRGLEGEKANFELKIAELMHKNEAGLRVEKAPDGDTHIIYERGDYRVVIKRGKEKVNYKRKADAAGEPPAGEGAEPDEEGGES